MSNLIGLIVGNGLAIDYRKWASPALDDLDPSDPLKWSFRVPQPHDGLPWADAFPNLHAEVSAFSGLPSFEVFNRLLQAHGTLPAQLDWEARQFLTFAYVNFHERYTSRSMNGWRWAEWTRRYAGEIRAAVSFNYEMLLEIALMHYGRLDLWSLAGNEMRSMRTLVFKPHGSIDYTTSAVSWINPTLPSNSFMTFNDLPIRLMRPDELRDVRPQPYTILPTEASHYRGYQYFRESFDWWQSRVAPQLTHVIIAGLSYFPCDQPEIDELLSSVNPSATFIVANPYPSAELRQMLMAHSRRYVEWRNGPEAV